MTPRSAHVGNRRVAGRTQRIRQPDCIDILLAEAPALDEKDLFVILTYLDNGPTALNNKVIHEALLRPPRRRTRTRCPCARKFRHTD
jgi:hypothetical protein